jgi:hypothetical protein
MRIPVESLPEKATPLFLCRHIFSAFVSRRLWVFLFFCFLICWGGGGVKAWFQFVFKISELNPGFDIYTMMGGCVLICSPETPGWPLLLQAVRLKVWSQTDKDLHSTSSAVRCGAIVYFKWLQPKDGVDRGRVTPSLHDLPGVLMLALSCSQ